MAFQMAYAAHRKLGAHASPHVASGVPLDAAAIEMTRRNIFDETPKSARASRKNGHPT
ncbi:MAG TPA: hypothetical protein VIT00_08315 [Terrimicrobiaceae bacterium]